MGAADVSVIVPFYNRENHISQGIEYLKDQDLQNIRFILIDDGSTDNGLKLAEKLTENDPRFLILHQNMNSGPSTARNAGIKCVSAGYVGFFDIDDSIPPDYFRKLFKKAEETTGDIIFTNYNLSVHRVGQHEIYKINEKFQALKNGAIWDKLFRWDKIKDLSFEPGLFCADNLFLFQAVNRCEKMVLIERPIYGYQLQSDSISASKNKEEKRKADIFLILEKMMKYAAEYDYTAEETAELKKYLVRSLFKYQNDQKWAERFLTFLGYDSENLVHKTEINRYQLLMMRIFRRLHFISSAKYEEWLGLKYIAGSSLFDSKWYLERYPEVKKSGMKPEYHYLHKGWLEGKDPGPRFDGSRYLAENNDVKQAGVCPLVHYERLGKREGRYVDRLFENRTNKN